MKRSNYSIKHLAKGHRFDDWDLNPHRFVDWDLNPHRFVDWNLNPHRCIDWDLNSHSDNNQNLSLMLVTTQP